MFTSAWEHEKILSGHITETYLSDIIVYFQRPAAASQINLNNRGPIPRPRGRWTAPLGVAPRVHNR